MKPTATLSNVSDWLTARVPSSLATYGLLGSIDLFLSKVAFSFGVAEANPVMDASLRYGVFELTKVSLTLTVVLIGLTLWKHDIVRRIMLFANIGMTALAVFHIYGLTEHVYR